MFMQALVIVRAVRHVDGNLTEQRDKSRFWHVVDGA